MAAVAASPSRMPVSPQSLWTRLVEPSASVVGPDRRTVRLLSSLLVLLNVLSLPLVFSQYVIYLFTREGEPQVSVGSAISLAVTVAAYFLSRTRFHRIAALMTVAITSVIIFGSYALLLPTIPAPTSETEESLIAVVLGFILMFVLLSVVLASIVLSKRETIWTAALNLLGMAILVATGSLQVAVGYTVIMFNLIISALIILAMHHRDQMEAERNAALETALKEKEAANTALAASVAMAHEASRLKSEFLANMSHELRTPLNAIIGFTEIMLAGMSGPLDEKQHHKLTRIFLNSKRLLDLINDLLDLAKIEAGRVEIVCEPFSPREFALTLKSQVESLAENKGLQLEVTVDPALPAAIIGDAARIEQIGKNLLSNAIKFTHEGKVMLSLCAVSDSAWSLSVCDTGIGIPPHALEFIFDEFRQVDVGSKRAYGGSGLGLAITRNLARIMGGEVRAQSAPGKGSTFTVTLPHEAVSVNLQTGA